MNTEQGRGHRCKVPGAASDEPPRDGRETDRARAAPARVRVAYARVRLHVDVDLDAACAYLLRLRGGT